MFLEKYVNNIYLDLIYSNYDEEYINNLNEYNFIQIYNLFKENNFYFMEDIILNYLEIFTMDYDEVYNGLIKLKQQLGDSYTYIIGNNMTYLEEIINKDS